MSEHKKIMCPFCDKGEVETLYSPPMVRFKKGTWGGSKPGVIKSAEKWSVITEKCPICGKSKQEIEKALKEGRKRPVDHHAMLERLKKAGLPTRV